MAASVNHARAMHKAAPRLWATVAPYGAQDGATTRNLDAGDVCIANPVARAWRSSRAPSVRFAALAIRLAPKMPRRWRGLPRYRGDHITTQGLCQPAATLASKG